jgi:uncharacterized membrane protein
VLTDPSESSFGLQPNIAAGLAALFGWIGGLIILLGKPAQGWVRFVAVQSIVLSVAYAIAVFALSILFGIAASIPGVRVLLIPIIGIAYAVLGIAYFVGWIVCTIKGFSGTAQRLPVIAEFADRFMPAAATL